MSDSMRAIDVAYQTNIAIENKSTEQLAGEINTGYHQAESLARMSYMYLADAGRKLIEVKGRLKHGQFESWCENNLEFSKSKAEKCMKLAKKIDDENSLFSKTETFTDIEISTVWALLSAPEEVAAEVIETNDVTDMTVRELKEEIARIKEEKQEAERAAKMAENSNNDIRKELASMQRKLSEAISEEDYAELQEAAEKQERDLKKEIDTLASANTTVTEKLEKAKADLKKAKEKLKESEAAKDEEVQKRLAEAAAELEEKHADDIKKAKEEGAADAEASLGQMTDEVMRLEAQIEKLESEKAKLSNNGIMRYGLLCEQLQDTFKKIKDVMAKEEDGDTAEKMKIGLHKIWEVYKP